MSDEQPSSAVTAPGRDRTSEATARPYDDSTNGLQHSASRPVESTIRKSAAPEPYFARLDFEPPHNEIPPRHPSRQMMTWGPPTDYEYDYRDDRGPYGRASHDYGRPGRGMSVRSGYYGEDPYYNRAYRRGASVRDTSSRFDAVRSPKTPKRRPEWHDPSDEESEEEEAKLKLKRHGRGAADSPPPEEIMRLPFTMWMNSNAKNHFVSTIGEFVGTTMFLFFAFAGTQVANIGAQESAQNSTTGQAAGFSPIVLLYIAIAFGFSLMVNVWIFFRISGGLFNPAVTLAMVMVKSINLTRGLLLFAAQLAGAIFASFIVRVLFPTPFNVSTTLASSTSIVRGVFIEAILTAELVFTIFMLAKEKHKATFIAPVGIGLALFVAELVGVFYTGGRQVFHEQMPFGRSPLICLSCTVSTQREASDRVGPAAGAVLAVIFYKFIKILEYEVTNPGQDGTSEKDAEAAAETPKKEVV